jgi:hypothetical protein
VLERETKQVHDIAMELIHSNDSFRDCRGEPPTTERRLPFIQHMGAAGRVQAFWQRKAACPGTIGAFRCIYGADGEELLMLAEQPRQV